MSMMRLIFFPNFDKTYEFFAIAKSSILSESLELQQWASNDRENSHYNAQPSTTEHRKVLGLNWNTLFGKHHVKSLNLQNTVF